MSVVLWHCSEPKLGVFLLLLKNIFSKCFGREWDANPLLGRGKVGFCNVYRGPKCTNKYFLMSMNVMILAKSS